MLIMKQIKNSKYWGLVCEEIATNYLKRKGYCLVERNYLKKCGEIDIIVEKDGLIHFVEVKGVIHETNPNNVNRVTTRSFDCHRVEDNLSSRKLNRLKRTIGVYLSEKATTENWCLDAILIYLNPKNRSARAVFMPNILI